jgi:predicted O-linked N-acetylglucosamine transferase (SPINDLY family)
MDYRFTDPWFDPPESASSCYAEQSIHLPDTYYCYQPPVELPAPAALPAMSAGHITFGCLNNFCKVSPPALLLWCELLREVPNSVLVVHAKQGGHRQRLLDTVAGQGIDCGRIRFTGQVSLGQYFDQYQRIDIGLDPFPYNGATTTCDALWMGVPVVSLIGQTAVGRAGYSILSNAGLSELVAHSPGEYVSLAATLARDLPRVSDVRKSLRRRMLDSPLMDAPRFVRNVEAAYRAMWRAWCEKVSQQS